MPTISINKEYFFKLLGKTLSDTELDTLCFDFGLETEPDTDTPENIRVEIPANRYDLLCVEGLAISLGVFLETRKPPQFVRTAPTTHLTVDPSVKGVRLYGVAGILRNIKFTEQSYKSFIDFQDKLHHNIGRKRTLVSIGTHDLDKVSAPFNYVALRRADFSFVPLNQNKSMTGAELMEFYKNDIQLKNYLHIIEHSETIPLIRDGKDQIMSMPPIINSELSKIDLNTKNVFIDITATDKQKALITLNLIISNFGLYTEPQFNFEAVEIRDTETFETPAAELTRKVTCSFDYLLNLTGVKLTASEAVQKFNKMGYINVAFDEASKEFSMEVPLYRSDVMHQCDLAEDLAIAVGYNNIEELPVNIPTKGTQNYLNKVSEQVRVEMSSAGYLESLNFTLCAVEDLTTRLKKTEDPRAVVIANPKTHEFNVGRTTLIPGLLKVLASNKSSPLPLSVFELGDVMLLTNEAELVENKQLNGDFGTREHVGSKNERRLAFAYSNSSTSGLDHIHGTLDLIFARLLPQIKYKLQEGNSPYFFEKLQAKIIVNGEEVGEMGIVHPEVLAEKQWPYPVSIAELNFEKLAALHQQH